MKFVPGHLITFQITLRGIVCLILFQIFTPTSTRISVILLKEFGNGRNMNIDIYLGEKDVNNTVGLCGHFDGNEENDFKLRGGISQDGNADYFFSESWQFEMF